MRSLKVRDLRVETVDLVELRHGFATGCPRRRGRLTGTPTPSWRDQRRPCGPAGSYR